MNTPLIILCLCFAGFVHGFTGFGYAMVAMALLPLLLGMPEALFLGALFMMPVAATLFWRNRRHYVLGEGWTLVAGAVAGTPVGLLLVQHMDRLVLLRLLGLVLIVFSLNELLFTRYWKLRVPTWMAFPIGVTCGILGAAFNIGGPPAIIYVLARGWQREQEMATLQVMYFFNSGTRVLLTLPTGIVTPELAELSAWALGPFVLVAILGCWFAARVPPQLFKRIVLVALIGIGLRYALSD